MTPKMQQAVDFLYATPKFTTKNSLDHTRKLMELLGNPCAHKKIIHVAGSNGKGSVCCFLYHMLLSAGKKAAMFTSPHLVDIRERFDINGEMTDEKSFLEAYEMVKAASAKLVQNNLNHPTFFEFIFAMGMVIFEKSNVEYVILETGLGGRLDATNSFPNPVLSVITSISLEHTEYLGDTIDEIAGEKAGIIRPGIPVLFDANDPIAAAVIEKRAKSLKSPYLGISDKMFKICEIKENHIDFSFLTDYDKTKWRINSLALYQVENAALAVNAMRLLQQMDKSDIVWQKEVCCNSVFNHLGSLAGDQVIQQGLLRAFWPGRMEEVLPDVYFDGAHNTAGITVFAETVRELIKEDTYPPLLLFSMVKEKDYHSSVDLLTTEIIWDAMAVTNIPSERGIPFEKLQKLFEADTDRPVEGFADYQEAFIQMCKRRKPGQKLFCTGSLYFIGALLEVVDKLNS